LLKQTEAQQVFQLQVFLRHQHITTSFNFHR
jgi:hypothetical protein